MFKRSREFRPMDTCVGCRIVDYLLSTVFYCVSGGCVISTIININRPYGATYSQTFYVPKYSPRCARFLRLLEVSILRSEHLIYHKPLRTLDIWDISKK